ncbi:uncharacterized protein NPIL_295611 [Nephila pilipes]|uniref:Reverse transcriptase domain-containing protein n=1 Tax=Nephila pilipes TaxID=299642 RepID=A0A8X6R095_NEPPI|nr:uncharacterized protein NPIL_295611 [Nephila pilipes]
MEEVLSNDEITSDDGFFLPHRSVLRSGNRACPLRVVFNGSRKTDLNISLNCVFSKGGVIQVILLSIMLRARQQAYFFSCDIRYMFRHIENNPEERLFQKLLWKQGLNEPHQICPNL